MLRNAFWRIKSRFSVADVKGILNERSCQLQLKRKDWDNCTSAPLVKTADSRFSKSLVAKMGNWLRGFNDYG